MSWQHLIYEIMHNFDHGRIHIRGIDGAMEILGRKHNANITACDRNLRYHALLFYGFFSGIKRVAGMTI